MCIQSFGQYNTDRRRDDRNLGASLEVMTGRGVMTGIMARHRSFGTVEYYRGNVCCEYNWEYNPYNKHENNT